VGQSLAGSRGAAINVDQPFLVRHADIVVALKTFAAAMLALVIALWLDLPRPYWAMATVYITSQPLEVIVTTDATRAADTRDVLNERLEAAKLPVRETKVVYRSNDNVEIAAMLISLAVDPKDLDAVVAEVSASPGVLHATWTVSTLD
jgi:Fusaric acid resistance protein family